MQGIKTRCHFARVGFGISMDEWIKVTGFDRISSKNRIRVDTAHRYSEMCDIKI